MVCQSQIRPQKKGRNDIRRTYLTGI